MRISDWSSDVCSSDLVEPAPDFDQRRGQLAHHRFVVRRSRREAQAFGAARDGREIDRLHIDAIFGEEDVADLLRSEEHTSELQSLMRISYAVFCLKKKKKKTHSSNKYTVQIKRISMNNDANHKTKE